MMHRIGWLAALVLLATPSAGLGGTLRGAIVDSDTGRPLAARVYLRSEAGEWLFVKAGAADGSALPYREQWVPMPGSVERHTTVSPHGFVVDLPPGTYTIEIERGKEYLPLQQSIQIGEQDKRETFRLKRWINMASRGWFSGETHVHRRLHELPNVMQAEDLNVAFPVTFWTTQSTAAPGLEPSTLRRQGPSPFGAREDAGTEPIYVDRTHVILPRNTEYEIFSVDGERHVLGAVFVLNHRSVLKKLAPPVGPIAAQAHAEGALLDLDKHSWPWSMMLVPVAKVDLYELSNNSVWRTQFGFRNRPGGLPEWLKLESDSPRTLTEWGWLNYGFQVYYALLNCGFDIMPTAGTASGVHPVPLGHSRVYVHTGESFDKDAWLDGLRAGRSFVTTGPMLFATVNDRKPGHRLELADDDETVQIRFDARSPQRFLSVEVIVNGDVVSTIAPVDQQRVDGAWQLKGTLKIKPARTSWLAIRAVADAGDGRRTFAHSAPWRVSVGDKPLVPKRREVEWFVELMDRELDRNKGVLSPAALAEFEQAREVYQDLLRRAK